jgi:cellulose synthase/poly-beta-1,6-N-acetylglucosamine synthase-like glycosyltransferase
MEIDNTMILVVSSVLLVVLACWASFFVLYQLGLACLYFVVRENARAVMLPRNRFAVIVPAHNEEVVLGTLLRSWKCVAYPNNMFAMFVIADNCTDRTGEVGRGHGAVVAERHDQQKKGKGQALAWAIDSLPLDEYDAVVIVDADTTVGPEFLQVMNEHLVRGEKIIQGYDGVLNPDENALTQLMHITGVMKNLLWNHAKSKVGLSVQLMGTGMCFDRETLKSVGWKAFSIGEDGEQFAYLAEQGIRVHYEPRAAIYAQEASSFKQAYSQRIRWVAGRMQLVGVGMRLLLKGIRRGDLHLVDAALTFLLPNYVELANATVIGLFLTWLVPIPAKSVLLLWFSALLGGQILYLLMGIVLSKPTSKTIGAVVFAPIFLLWRGAINLIAVFHLKYSVWVRTQRAPAIEGRRGANRFTE